MNKILLNNALDYTPRILSQLDRNPYSSTYGCFERNYWHYKTVTDFPSSTFQQSVLFFALLYLNKFEGNIYYRNKDIMNYIKAGIRFWTSIQNRDGSFNEWFPFEHSHVATAFTAYAISESLILLKEEFYEKELDHVVKVLAKAGRWLSRHPDMLVMNHTAGAAAALFNIHILTGDNFFLRTAQSNISIMKKNQSQEGWFQEYGGADIGYLSVSIDYLSKYYQKSGDPLVKKILQRACDFLAYFIHPDGSSGGEYGSRNVKYLMPHGLFITANEFDSSRYILHCWKKGFDRNKVISTATMDDRYLSFFLLPNYLQSGLMLGPVSKPDFNEYNNFTKWFPDAGLISHKNSAYHFVGNLKKNGIFKIFRNSSEYEIVLSDAGYFTIDNAGMTATTQILDGSDGRMITDMNKELRFEIKGSFYLLKQSLPMKKYLIPFRFFNYTVCRISALAVQFSKWLKYFKILKKKRVPLSITRSIELLTSCIIIKDHIKKTGYGEWKKISIERSAAALHVPSSRYFSRQDMCNVTERDFAQSLKEKGEFNFSRTIQFQPDNLTINEEIS